MPLTNVASVGVVVAQGVMYVYCGKGSVMFT